jgi:hypothetical protein
MGIRFTCPSGHKLHVKAHLAGKRGICPQCGAKILIPSVQESEPLTADSLADAGGVHQREGTLPKIGQSAALGSPSIIIAMADSPLATSPVVEAEPPSVQGNDAVPPPIASSKPVAPTYPLIAPDPFAPVSPATQYIARRERNRRNQLTMAIVLLMAVILLAVVLIFVLQRGYGQVTVKQLEPTRLAKWWVPPYVAMVFNHYRIAPCDQVSTT